MTPVSLRSSGKNSNLSILIVPYVMQMNSLHCQPEATSSNESVHDIQSLTPSEGAES